MAHRSLSSVALSKLSYRRRAHQLAALVAASVLLLCWSPAASAEALLDGDEKITLEKLEHADVLEVQSVLNMLKVQVVPNRSQRTLAIRGPADEVDLAIDLIERLDVPRPTRQALTVNAIVLDVRKDGDNPSSALPANLRAVADQLSSVFGYSSFRVLDTASLSVTENNRAVIEGGLKLHPDQTSDSSYSLEFMTRLLERDGRKIVQLEGLGFAVYGYRTDARPQPEDRNWRILGLSTSVEFEAGQTAVVGKASTTSSDATLVLIVHADLLDTP